MSQTRRLLFVLYEASFGGVERQAELLAEAAKQANHTVRLIVLGGQGPALPRFEAACDAIEVLHADARHDLQLWSKLRAAAEAHERYDAAFLFSIAKFAVLSNALRRAASRQALHVGNPVGVSAKERWKQQLRSWAFPPSTGLHLVANSQHTLRSLREHTFYSRFALDMSLNCVRIPETPVALRESCRPVRIGMVARLDPIKDHATLIRAVERVRRAGIPVECELLGGGPLQSELEDLAGELGLLDDAVVQFLGFSNAVADVVKRWDMFVFSVTDREGFGNAVAEAMAQGLPCILTDIGPCREVGADAVEYVPAQDPAALAGRIIALADDFTRRAQLGAAAHAHASKHFRAGRKLAEFLTIACSA